MASEVVVADVSEGKFWILTQLYLIRKSLKVTIFVLIKSNLCAGQETPHPSELKESTRLLQITNDFDPYSAMSTPIYQTATFAQVSTSAVQQFQSRSNPPKWLEGHQFRKLVGPLYDGEFLSVLEFLFALL